MPKKVKTYSDKDLLPKVANGDELAFAELFNNYRNKIYTIALTITGSEELAEEVVLDVFLKVWLKRQQLPEIEHFTAWLFTITRNHVFSMLKQLAIRRNAEDVLRPQAMEEYLLNSTQADYQLLDKECQDILIQAIDNLSPQQKKVYSLIKEQGLKREEAATLLNISPETVKRHLSEAMHSLRVFCLSRFKLLSCLLIIKQFL